MGSKNPTQEAWRYRKRTGKKGKREIRENLDVKIGTANITGAGSITRLEKCLSEAAVW